MKKGKQVGLQACQVKVRKLAGTSYGEVYGNAMDVYKHIARKTKRRPYIKSAYFKKQKVFFDYFWEHIRQKNPRERFYRLKYFAAAVELIERTTCEPVSQENPHRAGEILHRFAGLTREGELFFVQLKESKKTKGKYFMSCFSGV